MRKTLVCVLLFVCAVASAQQTEVTYSDDFQSYGSPKNAPGWVDTAIGTSKPEAGGLYKTWPDPTQGNKATNIVYGSKSASGQPQHANPRIGHFSTLTTKTFNSKGRFEYRGRFLRTSADARLGFSFLSSYPEKDSYYLIGLWSAQGSSNLTMQLLSFGAGTPSGTTNSSFTPAINTWYRFLIQVDDVAGSTKIRARFWADGSPEPTTFSIDATDAAATRLTAGRIGLWAAVKGANYFDDLVAKSPVDHTAPVITFSEGGVTLAPNTVTPINHDARVDVRAVDDLSGVATLTATADGQPYTPLTPITAEGPHTIAARAVDNVGNVSTSETGVLVDKTAPVITLTAGDAPLPLPISRFKTVPSITIAASDQWTGATVTATLNGQPYTSNTPITVQGTHHLVVEAVDGVKNKRIVQATILVDLGAPLIEFYEKGVKLTSPAKFKFDPSIEIRLTDDHSNATYTATLENGTAWKSLDPMPTGWHKLTVNAIDEAGNSSSATLDVLVDKDAPVIVLRESGSVLDPAVTAKYNKDLGVAVSITDATSAVAASTTTLNGQPYTSGTLITVERNTHTIAVHAEDEAGNVTDVTLSVLLDKTAPVIAFAEGEVKLDQRELQKFRRDATIAIDVTDVISTATYTATIATPARSTTAPYKSGTPVAIEDTHAITVQAVDEAGNTAASTLTILVDKTPPAIAFSASGTPLDLTKETPFGTDVAIDIAVTDNLPGVTYTAKLDGADYTTGTPITADGPHVVTVHAVDAAENTRDGEVKVLVDKSGPTIAFFESNVALDETKRNDFNKLPSIEIRIADALSTFTHTAIVAATPGTSTTGSAAYTSGTPVAEGYRTITVRAVDARGNVTEEKIDLLVDVTKPVVVLKDKQTGNGLPATGAIFNRDVTVDAAITDISKTTTAATLDGKAFSLSVPVSQEGLRAVEVTVTDELDWKTTVSSPFTVDKTAPVLTPIVTVDGVATTLLNGASFARAIAISVTHEDITAVQPTATIDGQPYTLGQSYSTDGPHTLVVNAVDAAGNHSDPLTIKFYIDKNAPEVSLIEGLLEGGQPFPQGKTFDRAIVASVKIVAATDTTVDATIDGQQYVPGTSYTTEGSHHLKVVVTNIAGLKTTVEADFTIDYTPPTVKLRVKYADKDEDFAEGMKFGVDVVPYTVADDNLSKPPTVVMTMDGQELAPGTVVSEEKFHSISAKATDDAGRSTTAGPFGFVLDKTKPEVTVTVDGEKLVDGAQFNKPITPLIEANDLTTPVYTITLDGASYTRGTEIANDLDHVLVVRVKDDLGNETVLEPIHFTIDKTAPVVRVIDKETNEPFTGGKFKRPVTAIVQIDDLTDTLTTATIVDRTTNQESPWSSEQEISSDGHYTLKITVADELGWVTPVPPIEFTIDKAAPVITVTERDVPLVTNTIFNRDAQPKITVNDTTVPIVDAKLNDQTFVSDTVVSEERKHTLVVKATDELGFVTELLPIVFTVDKTKPAVTVTEQGVVLNDNALLDHDAVPQVGVVDLTPFTIEAKVDGQPFVLGGSVTGEGPHTLDVSVTDAAAWNTTLPTIRFTVDKTAPAVRITENENGPALESGDEFKVTIAPWVHVTDITATTVVAKLNGNIWTPNTPVADEGTYVLEVTVTDAVGHITVVPPIAFIIDKSQPVVKVLESSAPFVTGTKLNRPAQLAIDITDLTRTTTVAKVGETAFTFPGTVDQDGKHTLTVTVTDNLGQSTTVPPIAFTVDQTRPVVSITEGGQPLQSGAAFNRNVKPEITITDLTETTVVATLDGQPYTFGTEITAEGQHTLTAEVTDELGWTTSVPAIIFFIDRTAPVVTIKEGENDLTDGLWFNRDVAPRAVVIDTTATTKTATLAKDGGAAEPYTLETAISAEGKYTLNVTVTDAVGLKSDVGPITFTIDKTPPAITINYPALNATLTTPRVVVIGDSDDAVSVTVNEVETTIDPAEKKYATNGALDLLEGENTLVAFGIDRAGNNTTITQVVQLDTRAPEVTITAPAANTCSTSRTVQVAGTIADPNVSGVRVAFTPGTAAPIDATLSADRRSWTATVTLPSEGKFVITATATDAGALQSLASVTVSVDETKPAIEITSGGAAIPQFTNRTVAPAVRVVDADTKAALTVTLDGAAYVSGTPIAAEKSYELKATATDCAGNKSDETIVRFTIDKTPPQFTALSPANGAFIGNTAQVSGAVSADTISVVAEEVGAAATVTNGAFAFGGLQVVDGINRYTLVATDRAGNTTRLDYSFRVKTSAPTVEIVENGSPIVNGTRYGRQVTVDIRSNESDAKLAATHNGQPFTSGATIATNGSHTIAATATDSFGHSSSHTVTFTIDLSRPVVTIAEPQDGAAVTSERIRVRGTISGDPVSATINGAALALTGDAFDTEVALDFGANDIVIVGLDAAGNAGQAAVEVTRGSTSTGLILTSPQDKTLTNRRTTIVSGQVLSPAGVEHVTVNGINIPIDAAGAFRKTDFALTEGQNVITASVSKGASQGSVSVTVTGDFTPPAVTIRESGNLLEDEARFASRAQLTVEATDGGQSLTPTVLIDAAAATLPATITASGGHTILAIARDAAGNEKRVERTFFVGAGGAGACALTDFDPANNAIVTSNTVTLVGRTGGAAGVKVNGTAATVTNGSFSATVNLPVEGANVVSITCTDASGNAIGTPASITLTRVTGAPSITIGTPADQSVTDDEAITVTGTIGGGVTEVTVNGSAATINGSAFTATNVRLAAGVNVVVARAKNAAGRTSSDSIRVTWLKNLPTITITSPAAALTTGAATIDVSGVWTNLDPSSLTVANGSSGVSTQTAVTTDTTGTFKAPTVSLNAGPQTITVRGVDRLGRAATATLQITRVDGKPSITISQPVDNSYFDANAGTSFTVSGTFNAMSDSTVEVNGVVATVDAASSTFTAAVPFSTGIGLTPVVARLSEPAGESAVDTVRVTKVAAAPRVLQVFPEANAVDVNAAALPLVLFSTAMDRATVRDAVRIEDAAGTRVTGDITLDRDVATFAPAVLFTAGERYTIRVTTAATDLAGNALAAAFSSTFTVAATAPQTAPTLNAYATRACGDLTLSGTAPANARIRIDLGTLVFNTTVTSTGAFSYKLPLSGRGGFQVARVRVVGSDGSLSPAAEASFEVDCAGPHVTDATFDRTANVITITFSKPIDLTTITTSGATGSVRLQLADGTFAGGSASLATPSIVSLTPAQNLGAASFTLTVTTAVKDTNGVAISSAYSRSFAIGEEEPGDGSGYIAGEIFDADTGRPLPGATVTIDVPVGAFARNVRAEARAGEVSTTSAVTAVADNRGRYLRPLPEGAHTIKASADGYTTVWRQIIVRAGVGVIPTDIRLTRRGAASNGNGSALVLTNGGAGDKPLSRAAELRVPGGVVATGSNVTLTSLGAQSLPGLLPLGWSPLASAEIVSNATSLSGSELTFSVPKDALVAASQTLTAVRYHEDRDEWRVITAVVPVSADGKATIPVAAAGAYALVYPDKAPHLQAPSAPTSGGVLPGVADRCATEACPPLVAKNALELTPPVVLPTQRTVATLRIEGSGTSVFPSGTAVQAYVDEELHLADGSRDVVSPFVTDLLLYRNLTGDVGEAAFHLAPSGRAAEVVLEVGYDHIRILPYPERLDRGALIGPEGGRVPADDRVAVEVPAGATAEALKATATSIQDFARFGTIPGYRIVGGLSLSLQWAAQTAGQEASAVELLKPARATFTVTEASLPSQLILVEVLEGTPYGRIYRLAAQITALDGGARFSTRTIDRSVLPVDGIIREGSYLLLAPDAPIAFATGTVRLGANAAGVAGARVLTPPLGVVDLTRMTGIFNVPVPASAFTLIPRTVATGDGAAYNHPSARIDEVINVGALSIVSQPPTVSLSVFSHQASGLVEVPAAGAKGVSPTTSVKATFSPGLDPASVGAGAITVMESGNVVPGRAVAQGGAAILWTLEPGTRLRPDATYTAVVSGGVRGTNGTPLGAPVSASFSTVSAVYDANVDPSKIRITMPDANGRSSIIGAAGALKEHWNAVAIRQGRDFSTRPQATADSQRRFRIELGTTANPNDRITIADKIYLQIINEAGAVAAIIPLGAFTSEDGRGFVARPDEETVYTTPDNITVAVPEGAFEVATVVAIRPADKSAIAGVPDFDQELRFHTGMKIDFEGIAKKRLDVSFPIPASLGASDTPYLGLYGQSVRGPRIMVIDLLRRDGANLTTHHPATSSARIAVQSVSGNVRSNAIINPSAARDMLLGIDRGATLIGFTFATPVGWFSFAPPPIPADLFIPPLKSTYFASFGAERGKILVPVPANTPFKIIGVDPGSGQTIIEAPFDSVNPGEPTDAGAVVLPSTNDFGPYPVFISPGRTETIDITSGNMEDHSIRHLVVSFDGSRVRVKLDTTDPMPEKTRLEIVNLSGGVKRYDDFSVSGAGDGITLDAVIGDRIVFLIGGRNVDPAENVLTVVFNEPLKVVSTETLETWFELQVADPTAAPTAPLSFRKIEAELTVDSGGRRVSIVHPGSLGRGKVYRLVLSSEILDRDSTTEISLAKKKDGTSPGSLRIEFAVREPKGQFGTFHLNSGGVRDLAKSGNVLFVSALDAGILAYDASNPAKLASTYPDPTAADPDPDPIGPPAMAKVAPPVGTDSQNWALATDDHGRLYATALSPMYGVVRSYRVEDFYCTDDAPACPKTLNVKPPVNPSDPASAQKGNAIITWRTGINVGMPLAAMIIGGWPEATPRKMQIITKDEDPETFEFPADPPPNSSGAIPGALGNGFREHTMTVNMTSPFRYGEQRVTVTNVTRGYSWSKDVRGSAAFRIIGKAGDQVKVVRNLTTYGVISLFGHGIGTYDLNAIEANSRNIGNPNWERLADSILLDTGDGGRCGVNTPCESPARVAIGQECPIADLQYSPDSALLPAGNEGLNVFALEQNRGVLQLNVNVSDSVGCGRAGSLIFQEKVNMSPPYGTGRRWAGHPRLNKLRMLFRQAAGRDPYVRYTSIGTYKHKNGNTYLLVAGNELGLLVAKAGPDPLTRDSLVDVVWIPGGAYSVRVSQEDHMAVVVDGKKRVLLVNLAQIDESKDVPPGNVSCGGLDCEAELYPTVKASLSAAPPPGSPAGSPATIPPPNNENGVGHDDPRILWKSQPGRVSGTLAPIFDAETGFLFTGDVLTRKMEVLSAVDPQVRFLTVDPVDPSDPEDVPRMRELDRVIPLGVEAPTPPAGTAAEPAGSKAAFQIQVALPGSMIESYDELTSIQIAVESERVEGVAAAQTPNYLPPAHLHQNARNGKKANRSTTFRLHHDAPPDPEKNLRFQRGWNRMISKWVVAVADPRASERYDWPSPEPDDDQKKAQGCYACKRPDFVRGTLGTDWYELYTAGRVIAVRPELCGSNGTADCSSTAESIFEESAPYKYLGDDKRRLEARIATVMADTVRPVQALTAAHGAPAAVGSHLETYMVHSGEVVNSTVDLDAGGRAGWNVVLDRTYRSRTFGVTPLGAGWDSSIFQRLRQLPNTDVEYRDGSGEVWRFKVAGNGYYDTPDGLDVKLSRFREGWRMTDGKQRITDFDELGRIAMQADEFHEIGTKKGNVITYSYRADGLLDRIVDPVGRDTEFQWEAGRLKKVIDWRDREVEYDVDSFSWLLDEVKLPRVRGIYSTAYDYTSDSSRPRQQYKYVGGTAPADAEVGTNLKEIIEPGDTAFRVKFDYRTEPSQRDMLSFEHWGTLDDAKSEFKYTLATSGVPISTKTVVTDALKQERTYNITAGDVDRPYSARRAQTASMVETDVLAWKKAPFGNLPTEVSKSDIENDKQPRTWTYTYVPKLNPVTGAENDPSLRGRLDTTTVTYNGASVTTTHGWEQLTPAGAVLKSREVSSSAGGMVQTYDYTGAFLDSITSDGQKLEEKDARRSPEPLASTDGGVTTETTRDDFGLATKIEAKGDGVSAVGPGSLTEITYAEADDPAEHQRGLPDFVKEGQVWTDVSYPDENTIVFNRIGRSYTTTKEYDEAGNIMLITATGDGAVATEEKFAYDARGRLARHRTRQKKSDASGPEKYVEDRYTYDRVGRIATHEKYEGPGPEPSTLIEKTTYDHDFPNRTLVTTLPAGARVTDTLDGLGRVQDRTIDPDNPYMADTTGNPTTMVARIRYDFHGNVVFETDDLTAAAMNYDGAHRLKGTITSGKILSETTTDGFGHVTKTRDAGTGYTVESQYTAGGKLQSTKISKTIGGASSIITEAAFTWDGAGRTRTSTSDPRFGLPRPLTRSTYDESGRLKEMVFGEAAGVDTFGREYEATTWSYGTTDHPLSITAKENDNTSTYTHMPTFDALGRPTKIATNGAADMTIEQKFDAMGNTTYVQSPERPSPIQYEHDGRGLVTKEKLPDAVSGLPTTINDFAYAKSGALERYTDATGEPTLTRNDGLGRPYYREYQDKSTEEIHYEGARVIKTKDRQKRWQHFVYEPQSGRLDKVTGDGGALLDDLDYDPQGRLISWKTADTLLEFKQFDDANRPQLTTQTRYRANGTVLDSYSQSHTYDGFGRRLSWTMPNGATLGAGWTSTVRPRYDAAGNVVKIERDLNGAGLTLLLDAEYRATRRPKHRTLSVNPASPSPFTIRREYEYEPAAGRLDVFRVFSGGTLMAGSDVAYRGTQLESATLLGLANGGRTTKWTYDQQGRLLSSMAASGDPSAAASSSSLTVLPKLNAADFIDKVETSAGTTPLKEFKETTDGHKIAWRNDPAKNFEYKAVDGLPGGVRTMDDRFLYEFDETERLIKVTQRPTGAEGSIYRIVYTYSGLGRMIGRRAEIAPATGSLAAPANGAFRPALPMEIGPDAGLPPETTFVWDPVSDQMVAAFDTATGAPLRQFIHGGMGLDDPIEVTVGETAGPARYYPIYDEAGDGGLQVILSETGKIVTRTIISDPYGDGEISLSGAAVQTVTLTRSGDGMNVDVEFTEPIESSTLGTGLRLASVTSGNEPTIVTTSSVAPAALGGDNRTIRWSLTAAQWAELTTPTGAASLSIAVTNALRASTYTADAPVMPANTTLRSGVFASVETPFDLHETFAYIQAQVTGSTPYTAYRLTSLAGMSTASSGGSSANNVRAAAEVDSGAVLLMTASFQAQSFTDPFTQKNYVRERWYDASTGSYLSPDPEGYVDSSNLYSFAGGDPVNRRDPTGEANIDPDTRRLLSRIQLAANVAARKHGMETYEEVVKKGDKNLGTKVHATLQKLLAPGGRFYDPRILTEVEVGSAGTIVNYGRRGIAGKDSLVKDVVILEKGKTAKDIKLFRTKARAVTQLVLDLKTGKVGARMHEAKTLVRFGVNNIELRAHGNIFEAFDDSVEKLVKLKKRVAARKKFKNIPGAGRLLGGTFMGLTAAQAYVLAEGGELDRAMQVMTGVDLASDTAEYLGNEGEKRGRKFLHGLNLTREDRTRMMEAIDKGEDPQQ